MIEPETKLLWLCEDFTQNGDDLIQNTQGVAIGNIYKHKDTDYILQACNNFLEAIELLKKWKTLVDKKIMPDDLYPEINKSLSI